MADFDHHCRFLNFCVAKSNYAHFVWLVVVLILDFFAKAFAIWILLCYGAIGGWKVGSFQGLDV